MVSLLSFGSRRAPMADILINIILADRVMSVGTV